MTMPRPPSAPAGSFIDPQALMTIRNLDHMFQPHVVFATAENAVRWLAARVDGTPLRRAA